MPIDQRGRAGAPTSLIQGPQPIKTLEHKDKMRFIGLILDHDIDGKPYWSTVELLQWIDGKLFNCNSGNYTNLFGHLTHWMQEPPL